VGTSRRRVGEIAAISGGAPVQTIKLPIAGRGGVAASRGIAGESTVRQGLVDLKSLGAVGKFGVAQHFCPDWLTSSIFRGSRRRLARIGWAVLDQHGGLGVWCRGVVFNNISGRLAANSQSGPGARAGRPLTNPVVLLLLCRCGSLAVSAAARRPAVRFVPAARNQPPDQYAALLIELWSGSAWRCRRTRPWLQPFGAGLDAGAGVLRASSWLCPPVPAAA